MSVRAHMYVACTAMAYAVLGYVLLANIVMEGVRSYVCGHVHFRTHSLAHTLTHSRAHTVARSLARSLAHTLAHQRMPARPHSRITAARNGSTLCAPCTGLVHTHARASVCALVHAAAPRRVATARARAGRGCLESLCVSRRGCRHRCHRLATARCPLVAPAPPPQTPIFESLCTTFVAVKKWAMGHIVLWTTCIVILDSRRQGCVLCPSFTDAYAPT